MLKMATSRSAILRWKMNMCILDPAFPRLARAVNTQEFPMRARAKMIIWTRIWGGRENIGVIRGWVQGTRMWGGGENIGMFRGWVKGTRVWGEDGNIGMFRGWVKGTRVWGEDGNIGVFRGWAQGTRMWVRIETSGCLEGGHRVQGCG